MGRWSAGGARAPPTLHRLERSARAISGCRRGGRPEDWVDLPLGSFAIHFQRMTLETFLGELLDAGFVLEKLVETRPDVALREIDEAAYARLIQQPSLIAVRMRSRG
jgi:hypothetical protein